MNAIRDREIDALVTPWINAQVAYLLAVPQATTTVEDNKVTIKVLDPTEYDEVVTTKDSKMIDAFSSRIIHTQMETMFTGVRLCYVYAYTEMCNGSKNVTIIMRNSMAYPQTLKKILVARVVAANWMPEPQMWPGMVDALDEAQGIQTQRLTIHQRQEKVFVNLELSGLGSWPPKLAYSAQSLLAEYHDIFSLKPCELGCTHLTKHVIKVTDDALFKE